MSSTTTKAYPLRVNMVRGMNRAIKPALLSDQWRTLFNMRPFFTRLTQVPRKRVFGNFCSLTPSDVLLLTTFPTGEADEAIVTGLTATGAFSVNRTTGYKLPMEDGTDAVFESSGSYERWGSCVYDNTLYFVNTVNQVHYCNGTSVNVLSNSPKGRYVEHYYDHIIVGSPIIDGIEQRFSIAWSHKDYFNEWTAKTFTEADEFDFHETRHGGEAVLNGVTGVGRLNDLLLIHTPSCVYQAQYVGVKQGVFRFSPVFQHTGCGFPYGLVNTGSAHFYPDLTKKTFYRLTQEGPQEIGAPVMDYLKEELSSNPEFAFRLYGYVDYDYREIHWVFCSYRSNGEFDREVVYNFDNDTWYCASVENVHSFCQATRLPKAVSELEGEAGDLTGQCKGLSRTRFVVPRIWGTKLNFLLAEETSDDAVTDLLEQPVPVLETGDFVYDDIARIKEVESMAIQAGYAVCSGLRMYYSVRNNVDDAVTWTTGGLWTATSMQETVLSSPRAAGRVWRFKFVPVSTGAGTEVVLNPRTRCAETNQTFEFITQTSVEFQYLCNESENFVGYWYEFYPAQNTDYKWRLRFVLPENRTLDRVEIYRLAANGNWGGQAWGSKYLIDPNLSGTDWFPVFPVAIFENGVQLWSDYQSSLGTIEAGEHEWVMYGDKFTNPSADEWFMLRLRWADGDEEFMTSALCTGESVETPEIEPTPCSASPVIPYWPSSQSILVSPGGTASYTVPEVQFLSEEYTVVYSHTPGSTVSIDDGDSVTFTATVTGPDGCFRTRTWIVNAYSEKAYCHELWFIGADSGACAYGLRVAVPWTPQNIYSWNIGGASYNILQGDCLAYVPGPAQIRVVLYSDNPFPATIPGITLEIFDAQEFPNGSGCGCPQKYDEIVGGEAPRVVAETRTLEWPTDFVTDVMPLYCPTGSYYSFSPELSA